MNRNLYLYEGKIEGIFIRSLINNRKIEVGKMMEFKFAERECSANNKIKANKWDNVYAIIDSDVVNERAITKITNNIESINAKNVYLLFQCNDFEDELKYILRLKSIKGVCRKLGCLKETKTDLKNHICKMTGDLFLKLEQSNADFSIMYTRETELSKILIEKNNKYLNNIINGIKWLK